MGAKIQKKIQLYQKENSLPPPPTTYPTARIIAYIELY